MDLNALPCSDSELLISKSSNCCWIVFAFSKIQNNLQSPDPRDSSSSNVCEKGMSTLNELPNSDSMKIVWIFRFNENCPNIEIWIQWKLSDTNQWGDVISWHLSLLCSRLSWYLTTSQYKLSNMESQDHDEDNDDDLFISFIIIIIIKWLHRCSNLELMAT